MNNSLQEIIINRTWGRQEYFANILAVLEIEKYIPFMSPDELHEYEQAVTTGRKPIFSPDALVSWKRRASEREEELAAKFAATNAKSAKQCKRLTVKKIISRFLQALYFLKSQRVIRGKQTFTTKFGINRWNMNTLEKDMGRDIFQTAWLAYLVE